MINLLPKENKNGSGSNHHFKLQMTLAVAAITCVVFSLGLYWGYLYHQVSLQQAKLEELQLEMKCYNTPYQKVRNMESILEQLHNKEDLKRTVLTNYLPPLNALNSLIQTKTASIWFERVQFDGQSGSFIITGGATNYKAWAAFIGALEQNKDVYQELKPDQATIHDGSGGREYVQFKVSGVLAKRGDQYVQEP